MKEEVCTRSSDWEHVARGHCGNLPASSLAPAKLGSGPDPRPR